MMMLIKNGSMFRTFKIWKDMENQFSSSYVKHIVTKTYANFLWALEFIRNTSDYKNEINNNGGELLKTMNKLTHTFPFQKKATSLNLMLWFLNRTFFIFYFCIFRLVLRCFWDLLSMSSLLLIVKLQLLNCGI